MLIQCGDQVPLHRRQGYQARPSSGNHGWNQVVLAPRYIQYRCRSVPSLLTPRLPLLHCRLAPGVHNDRLEA